jgi:hypothetical protein
MSLSVCVCGGAESDQMQQFSVQFVQHTLSSMLYKWNTGYPSATF